MSQMEAKLVQALDRRSRREWPSPVKLRQLNVVSVQGGPPPSLTLNDRGTNISGIRYLDSYSSPQSGDAVWALIDSDADIIVLGRLAT